MAVMWKDINSIFNQFQDVPIVFSLVGLCHHSGEMLTEKKHIEFSVITSLLIAQYLPV